MGSLIEKLDIYIHTEQFSIVQYIVYVQYIHTVQYSGLILEFHAILDWFNYMAPKRVFFHKQKSFWTTSSFI